MAILVITIVAACLLAFGVWYARLEYRRPLRPTYWAVVIGVGVTVAGQVVMAIGFYLLDCGVWGIVAGIVTPFVLTGVPMAIGQEIKERRFVDEANSSGDTGELGRRKDGNP
jgi:amino acid transporter